MYKPCGDLDKLHTLLGDVGNWSFCWTACYKFNMHSWRSNSQDLIFGMQWVGAWVHNISKFEGLTTTLREDISLRLWFPPKMVKILAFGGIYGDWPCIEVLKTGSQGKLVQVGPWYITDLNSMWGAHTEPETWRQKATLTKQWIKQQTFIFNTIFAYRHG